LTGPSEGAAAICERLLGASVLRIERPGGAKRGSVRVFLKDRSVIATHRLKPERTRLEAEVLRTLGDQGAPVPQVIAFDGAWLIQEDLGVQRLTQTLATVGEADGEVLLANAIAGIAAAQQAGRGSDLNRHLMVIGTQTDWLMTLATGATRLGQQLQSPAPALPTDRLIEQLRPRQPTFIKWDARPANAIARPDASVAWFDWEHCGARHPLDDLVWLLCDEYIADRPDLEARLIERFLPLFLNGLSPDAAHDYLMTFGALHCGMRLGLILREKGAGPWWDLQQCLDQDNVGVTLDMAVRLCRRGARWAAQGSLTRDLKDWLEALPTRLERIEARAP